MARVAHANAFGREMAKSRRRYAGGSDDVPPNRSPASPQGQSIEDVAARIRANMAARDAARKAQQSSWGTSQYSQRPTQAPPRSASPPPQAGALPPRQSSQSTPPVAGPIRSSLDARPPGHQDPVVEIAKRPQYSQSRPALAPYGSQPRPPDASRQADIPTYNAPKRAAPGPGTNAYRQMGADRIHADELIGRTKSSIDYTKRSDANLAEVRDKLRNGGASVANPPLQRTDTALNPRISEAISDSLRTMKGNANSMISAVRRNMPAPEREPERPAPQGFGKRQGLPFTRGEDSEPSVGSRLMGAVGTAVGRGIRGAVRGVGKGLKAAVDYQIPDDVDRSGVGGKGPSFAMGTPNVPSMASSSYKAGAARVPGRVPDTPRDTVHAMLMPGEAVLNKPAADMMGRGRIAAANARGRDMMGVPGGPSRSTPSAPMSGMEAAMGAHADSLHPVRRRG